MGVLRESLVDLFVWVFLKGHFFDRIQISNLFFSVFLLTFTIHLYALSEIYNINKVSFFFVYLKPILIDLAHLVTNPMKLTCLSFPAT